MQTALGNQTNRLMLQKRHFENDNTLNCKTNVYSRPTLICKAPRYELPVNNSNTSPVPESKPKFWRKSSHQPIAPFTKYEVPELVLLEIFSYLNKHDLCNAMRTCMRFYHIGNISTNWKTLDMSDKQITDESLIAISRRHVHVMKLSGSKLVQTTSTSINTFSTLQYPSSRLQYLDLSRAEIDEKTLLRMFQPCTQLICISLEGLTINDDICHYIGKNNRLTHIDFSMTKGITKLGILRITSYCRAIQELNLSWCGLTEDCCELLAQTLTFSCMKLNLSGTSRENGLADKHIDWLTNHCHSLRDLDVSDNVDLTKQSVLKLATLTSLRKLSCNRCYGIDPNIFLVLNNTNLQCLNVHGCIAESTVDYFKNACKQLIVNRDIFNYTAKPSDSSSANSSFIWGKQLYE
ncbi:unnamed protein product [Caenorhabditis angaria]|uniref:F-box domain-containing protein n=1 Tax=Caenorhabditis angaria TaxID=860376 RepID=A0A9P1IMN3_9PELO|nr:unnamed protein product [Caenorhabditis angaria]